MTVIVSACLLGQNCKYNGGNNYSDKLEAFLEGKEVISVCPEVMGGLTVPRKPGEIVNGVVKCEDGTSVDFEYRTGAKKALDAAISSKAEIAILQSRSPSCGCKKIYDGTFTKTLIDGMGIFASLLNENGIKTVDIEDI